MGCMEQDNQIHFFQINYFEIVSSLGDVHDSDVLSGCTTDLAKNYRKREKLSILLATTIHR